MFVIVLYPVITFSETAVCVIFVAVVTMFCYHTEMVAASSNVVL